MYLQGLLSAGIALLAVSPLQAFASPIELGDKLAPTPVKRAACATIDQFTVASFAAASTLTPTENTCLFYTRRTATGVTESLSKTAQCYAKANGLTTIWDLWPNSGDKDYYNMEGDGSWLSCINDDDDDRNTYFSNMSQAFAESCSGTVLVMTDDPKNLPQTGIWYNTELPTLKGLGSITSITAVDVNGENGVQIYPSSSKKRASLEDHVKRDDSCSGINTSEPSGEDWFG